jgi:hypothetical protein
VSQFLFDPAVDQLTDDDRGTVARIGGVQGFVVTLVEVKGVFP